MLLVTPSNHARVLELASNIAEQLDVSEEHRQAQVLRIVESARQLLSGR